jgi:hypothetical protein
MEPVNQSARSSAINKFIGVYGFSLLVVLIGAFFLFNTPASLFKNQIQFYKSSADEQTQLLSKVDGMTSNLKNISLADQNYLSSTNEIQKGNLQTSLQDYQRTISDNLSDIKNDSLKFSSSLVRKDSYNYILAFNAISDYRNTILSLQKTLQEKGGDATELLKTKSLLDGCNAQLEIYKALAANKPAVAPAVVPVPAGGGGGGAKEAQLQQQLEKAQADLAACQKAKAGTVAPAPSPAVSNFDESKKAVVLFEAGQDLYNKAEITKNPIERRGILISAKLVFEKSKPSYPDADKMNKTIIQIDAELKKLSNMG